MPAAHTRPATTPTDSLPTDDAVARATLPVTLLMQAASSASSLAPAVAAPQLLAQMHLGVVAVGLYIALVYLAAMVSSQWGAALVRRWGPIRTSQVALACSAIGLLGVATAVLPLAIAGCVLLGIGYGPITPASSDMLARTTPPHRFALVFSVKQTGVPLGGALAGLMVPIALVSAGSAVALEQVAALCALGCVLAAVLRRRLDGLRDAQAPWPTWRHTTAPIRFVLAHPVLRHLSLCTVVFAAVQVSLGSYLVSFLHAELAWPVVAAGAASAAAQGAAAFARIAFGLVADRLVDGARRTLLALAVVMAISGLAMLGLRAGTPHAAVIALAMVYGASAIGWNGVFLGTVAQVVPRAQAAMATAGSLFFTFFGVVIGPPLFGLVGDLGHGLALSFALLALPLAWTIRTLWRAPRAGARDTEA